MRTSVTCRRARPSKERYRGFTLLELVVVLAIVASLTGVVVPQLWRLATSFERAGEQSDVLTALNGVGYRAYASGKPIVLSGALAGPLADDGKNPLPIPAGWRLQFPQPVLFGENGVCEGGRVQVTAPDGQITAYRMRSPKCRAEPLPASS